MKRDWELIRKILIAVEEQADGDGYVDADVIPGHDRGRVSSHIEILGEAGLIKARRMGPPGSGGLFAATALTWRGHELLGQIRKDSAWGRIKSLTAEKGLSLSVDVIVAAARSVIEELF
jgi:DNA-binding transcriptional ArsR family regulator